MLPDSPIRLRRGAVQVGEKTLSRDDVAFLFLYPRPEAPGVLVGVVGGTGIAGLRLTDRLPYFVSGVAYPDWTVATPDVLSKGVGGVAGAGFFGNDWRIDSGDAAWAETATR
jgi:hypothetical protein